MARDPEWQQIANIEHCKGVLRHAWFPTPSNIGGPGDQYIVNRCERCDTERRMPVDAAGNSLGAWKYDYADKALYKSVTGSSLTDYRAKYLAEMAKKTKKL